MIRLWKLGNADKEKYPTQSSVDTLTDILKKYKPGEVLDIIWGDDISITVIKDDGTVETEDFATLLECLGDDNVDKS